MHRRHGREVPCLCSPRVPEASGQAGLEAQLVGIYNLIDTVDIICTIRVHCIMYIYISLYIYIYIYIYIYVCMYVCIYIYTYVHRYLSMYVCCVPYQNNTSILPMLTEGYTYRNRFWCILQCNHTKEPSVE